LNPGALIAQLPAGSSRRNFVKPTAFTDGQDFLGKENVKAVAVKVAINHRFSKLSAASAYGSARFFFGSSTLPRASGGW
jgi:hypothetical protein